MISTIVVARKKKNCGPSKNIRRELVFEKIGNFKGVTACGKTYSKEFYIPKIFDAYWHEVTEICQSYGMDAVSLETKKEAEALLSFLALYKWEAKSNFYIGGMTLKHGDKNNFFWTNSGNRIEFELDWGKSQPDGWEKPEWGKESCLSIRRDDKNGGRLGFNDVFCNAYRADNFVCELIKQENVDDQWSKI